MSEKQMPLVSVYVPCHNVETYVEKCVRSIMAQTYKNLDIVLIDNNSTDGTGENLKKMAKEDSRIRVVFNPGEGISDARNVAAGLCHGEWIVEADSDDTMTENAVDTLVNLAVKNNCDLACCSYYLCKNGQYSEKDIVSMKPFFSDNREEIHKYFLTNGRNFNQTWGKIYKKTVLEKAVYPKGKLYEDLAVMPTIIENTNKCIVSDEPVYHYLIRPGSISTGAELVKQLDGMELRLNNCNFYEKNYPNLAPLAYDCVLEFAFFMMGKIYRAGIKENAEVWKEAISTVGNISKKAAKQGMGLKVGTLLTLTVPKAAAALFSKYTRTK